MSFVKKLLLMMANAGPSPRKMPRCSRPFTVAVEGNIGSGKTTFIKHFNKFNNVALFSEPIDLWRNCDGHNLLVSIYHCYYIYTIHLYYLLFIFFFLLVCRSSCTKTQRNGATLSSPMFSSPCLGSTRKRFLNQ